MKHRELVRWRLTHEVTHYTMLTMRRFTTMSYCLPNWRLIYTSLLLVSILFAGCRSDADIETQPASKLSPDQLVAQTFNYIGSDQTVQTIMESIKQLPEAKGMAAHLSQVKARLVWQGISHVGEVGVNEIVYIPIHIQGENEINWIWVIYLDHGTQISSEFLNRAEVYDDHLWLFDYLTQKGLGHVAKSGVYYTPPPGARSFRKVINGKLYECTRAHSFTVGNLYDDDMNVVDGGSSTRFHPENCVPVFEFQGFDRPRGRFSGAPAGFWGRFSGADSGNPRIAPEQYKCIRYAPTIPDEPPTPIGPIQPPPCGDYRMKIQEPQMNSHIKSLFDYVRSEEAQGGIERAFIQLSDGSFKDIQGVKKDAVRTPAEDVIGIMHTHIYRKNSPGTDTVKYSNQSFSLADIHSFVAHVSKSIAKELAKNSKTGSPVGIDLSKYYTGIVSKHGVYILSFNKKIKTYSEFIDLFGPVNSSAAASDSAFQSLIKTQNTWIVEQIDDVNGDIDNNENDLLTREEQYILDHIREYYPSLKSVLGLMFFDLTKKDPEGFSVYDKDSGNSRAAFKKLINRNLFYNRHDCK